MDQGIAHITFGKGDIETAVLPNHVRFDPPSFPTIVDGEDVFFERDPQDARLATSVVAASEAALFAALGVPQAGLTKAANQLLVSTAAGLLADSASSPTEAEKRERLKSARLKVASVARLGDAQARRIGVKDVRKALK